MFTDPFIVNERQPILNNHLVSYGVVTNGLKGIKVSLDRRLGQSTTGKVLDNKRIYILLIYIGYRVTIESLVQTVNDTLVLS